MPLQDNWLWTQHSMQQVQGSRDPQDADHRPLHLQRRQATPVTRGRISKVVRSFGSRWGRIRPSESSRDVFFNLESLSDPDLFETLKDGQYVEFEEEDDRANGTRAVNLVLTERLPVSNEVES